MIKIVYESKIIYGLSDIHYSIDGINIKPLLGGLDISVEFEDESMYAKINGVDRIKISSSLDGDGTLNILGMTIKEMKDILGYQGVEGEMYMQDSFNAPYVTLLFARQKANGEKLLNVLYKCKFDVTGLSAKTIQENVEQENIELKFKCIADNDRYNLQYFILDTETSLNKDKIDNFFKEIQIPEGVKK